MYIMIKLIDIYIIFFVLFSAMGHHAVTQHNVVYPPSHIPSRQHGHGIHRYAATS